MANRDMRQPTADDEDRGINVFLRIRPSKNPSNFFARDDLDENNLSFKIPKAENLIVNNSRTAYNFKFHGILEQNAIQEEVFNKVGRSAVQNVLLVQVDGLCLRSSWARQDICDNRRTGVIGRSWHHPSINFYDLCRISTEERCVLFLLCFLP